MSDVVVGLDVGTTRVKAVAFEVNGSEGAGSRTWSADRPSGVVASAPGRQELDPDGLVDAVLDHPQHPYTIGLMGAIPSVGDYNERLAQIEGSMPRLTAIPAGCAFNPRCTRVNDVPGQRCTTERPGLLPAGKTQAACWLHATDRVAAHTKVSA